MTGARDSGDIAPPAVSPDEYDETYFRECNRGYDEWAASEGARVAGIYPGILHRVGFKAGETVVDLGTGRGELLAVAVQLGAERAIGVEYAEAAVRMAEQTIAVHGVGERATVHLADARSSPVEDACADLVTLLDVVEHLTPEELHRALLEAHRILKPGGRITIHTAPNRLIYDVTYRLQRALVPVRRRTWPADPRKPLELVMHVNEQTLGSLKKALREAGFIDVEASLGEWIYTDFVPSARAKRTYGRLARLGPLAALGIGDLFADARKR